MRRILVILGLVAAFALAGLAMPNRAECNNGACRGQSCNGICPMGCACVPFYPPSPNGKCV